jgi:hypothetical protein
MMADQTEIDPEVLYAVAEKLVRDRSLSVNCGVTPAEVAATLRRYRGELIQKPPEEADVDLGYGGDGLPYPEPLPPARLLAPWWRRWLAWWL